MKKTGMSTRIKWISGGVGAAIVVVTAIAVGRSLAHRPPSPSADPVKIAKFAATPDFAQMTVEQKEPYLQALRTNMKALVAAAERGEITREEQREAVRNGFRTGARLEAAKYVALPEGPQRKADLDRLIDEQEQLRQYASQVAAKNGTVPRFGGNPVEMKKFIESLPSEERVQVAKLGYDLIKRRVERGLPMWPIGGAGN